MTSDHIRRALAGLPPDESSGAPRSGDFGGGAERGATGETPRGAGADPPARRRTPVALAAPLWILAVLGALAALREGEAFVVPTLLGGLLAIVLTPVSHAMEKLRIPRALAALLLVSGMVAGAGATVYAISPSVDEMYREAPEIARRLERMARQVQKEVEDVAPSEEGDGGSREDGDGEASDDESGLMASSRAALVDTAAATPTLLGATIYGVFLSYFLLSERSRISRSTLSLARTGPQRRRLARGFRQIRGEVAVYLFAVTVVNIALGAAVAGVFWLLGMQNPLTWGALMTALNFIPYLGPLIMNLLVIGVGLATMPDPEMVVAPVLALMTLNIIEGYIVTPSVVGERLRVGPLAIFFAVAFGAWLWGAAGALIATPALIVIRAVLTDMLRRRAQS